MKVKDFIAKASICTWMLCFFWAGSLTGDEFPFEPPQNFTLNPKYIAVHHPVNTSQVLAQLYFDQGLTFLYAFNHDAAYWSFLRASEVDPHMPMAYWGMALSLGSNINMEITPKRSQAAYQVIQKGLQLALDGSESERDYIKALSSRYSNDANFDQKQLAINYNQAMRELSNKYPDDLDANVLFAESLLDVNPWNQWSVDGKPLEGTMEAVRKLQSVLRKDPRHLGANHYYIHAVEASTHPEIALMSAERLKTLLPSSGHILHMPSHIYLLVGDYLQAAKSNEEAIAMDREYIREYGLRGIYPVHYLSHNMYFLSRAYTMLGCFEDAKQAAQELTVFYAPYFKQMPELEYYASSPLTVLVTFHRWKEILEMPRPNPDLQMTTVLWHFGRAMAFAGLGDVSKAITEQRLFLEEKKKLSDEQAFGYNKAYQILRIANDSLEAKLAEAQGNLHKAVDFLKKAVAEQDTLRYNEPPDWFFPIRETYGGLLLRMHQFSEAEAVFRDELKRHPRNGRALFGLRESLQAQSKTHDLYWINDQFQKAWRYSDSPLTVKEL
jgi:hypothetical protein